MTYITLDETKQLIDLVSIKDADGNPGKMFSRANVEWLVGTVLEKRNEQVKAIIEIFAGSPHFHSEICNQIIAKIDETLIKTEDLCK